MQDNQRQTHEWAYIAGIMDADGCFMIFKHKRKTQNRKTSRGLEFPKRVDQWAYSYLPGVKICMIEPEAIDFVMNDMGFGHMHIDGARKDRPNSKPIYHWYMRNKEHVIPFLEGIIPYLRVKKNRAEHILKFCKHLMTQKNPGYRGVKQEELDYREEMYRKIREFNGNKVAATTKSHGHESANDSLTL
jgi:hypothetical protein